VPDFAAAPYQDDLDAGQGTAWRQSFGQTQGAFRERDDGHLPSLRRCRHNHADCLAQTLAEPGHLARMPRIDDLCFHSLTKGG
jgi:hypothetical protein